MCIGIDENAQPLAFRTFNSALTQLPCPTTRFIIEADIRKIYIFSACLYFKMVKRFFLFILVGIVICIKKNCPLRKYVVVYKENHRCKNRKKKDNLSGFRIVLVVKA